MSAEFISRIIGLVLIAALGAYWGLNIGQVAIENSFLNIFTPWQFAIGLGILGAVLGFIITPFITVRPFTRLFKSVKLLSFQSLLAALLGLIIGLIIAALFSFPISLLPSPVGDILPFIGVLLFSYIGVAVALMRQNDISSFFSGLSGRAHNLAAGADRGKKAVDGQGSALLDTSVIIDGRIADIAETGFMPGKLIIPNFVLNELQYIADSPDSMRRQRGRRGMEVVSQLQRDSIHHRQHLRPGCGRRQGSG